MVRCCEGCRPACDFCRFYDRHSEPYTNESGETVMVYVGKGECKHEAHPGASDPGSYCDDFHCFRAKCDE